MGSGWVWRLYGGIMRFFCAMFGAEFFHSSDGPFLVCRWVFGPDMEVSMGVVVLYKFTDGIRDKCFLASCVFWLFFPFLLF